MLVNDLILPLRAELSDARMFLRELERDGVVIGTDEAGRGALAGPVVAAAVILTPRQEDELLEIGLKDSKRLTPLGRERIFTAMNNSGVMWRAYMGSPEMIDDDNILNASLFAMRNSVLRLERKIYGKISCVIVDGTDELPDIDIRQWTLIRADDLIPCVSAASIVAKVIRDRLMVKLSEVYPSYDLAKNKGYPTQKHMETVRRIGVSGIHRMSFCRKILAKGENISNASDKR